MMNLKKCTVNLKSVLLVLFCSACGPQALNGVAGDVVEPGHQKPGADIQLITPQAVIREVGDSLSFNLGLRVGHPEGLLIIRLGSSDGVKVLQDESIQIALGESAVIALPINLYAQAKGRHYLPINAIVELPSGQRLHRAFSIVVQVGRATRGKRTDKPKPIKDQNDRPIKILPATEELR